MNNALPTSTEIDPRIAVIQARTGPFVHTASDPVDDRWIRSVKQRGANLNQNIPSFANTAYELNGSVYYFDTPELAIYSKCGKVIYYGDTSCLNLGPGHTPHYARTR